MKYSGIDLHSNNSVVVVSDEADRVLVRRRLPNDAATILAVLAVHRDELAGVVVESTYNWYWLVDALQAAGHRVHLANTAAIKRYEGLKHSDDEDGAAYLAQLLRLGILPCGYICPPAARAVRDLARKRMQLMRSRTAQVLCVENMLSRETGAGMRSYAGGRLQHLWRAVDQDGSVLDILVQSRRTTKAAARFFRKLLRGLKYAPRVVVTDKLASYNAPCAELLPNIVHRRDKGLNNRAENSHQPSPERGRQMRGFKSARHAQRFLSMFGMIADLFSVGRHLLSAVNYRNALGRRFIQWRELTGASAIA